MTGFLNQTLNFFVWKKSDLGGVLWKLVQLRRITDVGMGAKTPTVEQFLWFFEKKFTIITSFESYF